MSRIALFATLTAAVLLSACTSATTGSRTDTVGSYKSKTEYDQDRRFIFGIPQNDR